MVDTAARRGMSGQPFPPIDPARNTFVLAVGRKGSGKSHAARALFTQWPGTDRLVIDPNGDVDAGQDAEKITAPLPARMPDRTDKRRPRTLHYVADPASPTYADDLDRALAVALYPRDRQTLVWVDEAAQLFPANATGPLGRVLLQQSRHYKTSALLCCPRPVAIDPLVVSQADRVLIFDLPHPRDRARIAENIGWPPRKLDELLDDNRSRGPYWSLMYDAREHALYRVPPFPS